MKRLFCFIFLLSLLLNSSYGKEIIGLKFGFNVSNTHKSYENYDLPLFGYNTGIILKFKMKDNLLLNTEALVISKGYQSQLAPNGAGSKYLTYLSFPALIEYYPIKWMYIQAGPEFNFLVMAEEPDSNSDKNIYNEYNKFDLSLAGGLGFKISRKFCLETRYSWGLSQIMKNEDSGSIKNRTLQINLIYLFNRKKYNSGTDL